ncbi:hypothetical protein DVH24_001273 [Malus domestica]|uniref:Uncharacterized protein n=1 Tax=Malus domestica TaxID=3750 RepID=A0A498JYT0_MALDO|nr:hypothetical protein DVH24_001273 [Malus domestica]
MLTRVRNGRVGVASEAATTESLDEVVVSRPRPTSKAAVEALEKLLFDERANGWSHDQYCVVFLEKILSGSNGENINCRADGQNLNG